jgi:hypothetical protein
LRAAFHFDAAIYESGDELFWCTPFFDTVLTAVPSTRRHVRVHVGDLLISRYSTNEQVLAKRLLTDAPRSWRSLDQDEFVEAASAITIFVLEVNGLTMRDAQAVDGGLRERYGSSYLGALEVDPRADSHWVLYHQSLVPKYRIVGSDLRILQSAEAIVADPQTGLVKDWTATQPFETVRLENIGMEGSIFDPYDNREQARRTADVAELLTTQVGAVAEETLLRLNDLDPRITEILHAAFTAAEQAETGEQLAQVALSCRRFTERLADTLFPPTTATRNGRKLGPEESRNRLWAYVEDHTTGRARDLVLSSLKDVGGRIDALGGLANKGLHADLSPAELQRLLVALVTLAYDILTLAPPPLVADMERYREPLLSFLTDASSEPDD